MTIQLSVLPRCLFQLTRGRNPITRPRRKRLMIKQVGRATHPHTFTISCARPTLPSAPGKRELRHESPHSLIPAWSPNWHRRGNHAHQCRDAESRAQCRFSEGRHGRRAPVARRKHPHRSLPQTDRHHSRQQPSGHGNPKKEEPNPSTPPPARRAETTYGKAVEKAKENAGKHDKNIVKPVDEILGK